VPAGERPVRRRRRRWPKIVAACLVAVLLAAGGLAFAAWRRLNHLDHNIHRVGALSTGATDRPKVSELAGGAMNILATGSDARAGEVSHSDTVMLIHLNSAHTKAYVISLPRDSWVPISGHGDGKLSWALSYKNGQTVLWQTVEALTNVRVDHYVGIDFGGFQKLVDELGGVDIVVDKDTSDERIHLTAGPHHLNGADALKYVRQRHNLANGDIDRERRQQQFLHAIMVKVSSEGVLTDFGRLNSVAEQVTKNLSADDGFHVLDMAWNLRHLQANDVTYLTVPTASLDYHPAQDPRQSAVQLSSTAGDLWQALADDTVDAWIAAHPQNVTNPDHGV
jgi:LCP family protein required for cell wall assembly